MANNRTQKNANGSALDFEAQLWAAADKLRGHMDASEYKNGCLGLIFLKYISDAFEEKREQLLFGFSDPKNEVHQRRTATQRNCRKPRRVPGRKCLLAPSRSTLAHD